MPSRSGGSDLAILVPVLGRPHRVAPLLASARAATPDARVLFIANPDDGPQLEALRAAGAEWILDEGRWPGKINAGVRATREPYVLLAADDLDFRAGWYEAAVAAMSDTVGVVGTQDLGHPRVIAGELSAHPLVARWYAELGTIDEPDRLLHEGYWHGCVDRELVEVAKARGAWAFADDAVVEHLHPSWGKGALDDTYRKGRRHRKRDRHLLARRRLLWAPPTVLIPFEGEDERAANFAWVRRRYEAFGWPVVVAAPPGDEWHKAGAIAAGLEGLDDEGIVVIADADSWCEGVRDAVEAVAIGVAPWARPHNLVYRLTAAATAAVRDGAEPHVDMPTTQRPYRGTGGGGVVVSTVHALRDVPMDLRFRTWGGADGCWRHALRLLVGGEWSGAAPLFHLWHVPQYGTGKRRTSRANGDLIRAYKDAATRRDTGAMRDLVEAGKRS